MILPVDVVRDINYIVVSLMGSSGLLRDPRFEWQTDITQPRSDSAAARLAEAVCFQHALWVTSYLIARTLDSWRK